MGRAWATTSQGVIVVKAASKDLLMQVLFVLGLTFLASSACSSSGVRPDGGMEVDAKQAIDAWEPPGPPCYYKRVTLSTAADGTPCAFVNVLPPDYWSDPYTDIFVYLNGLLLTGPVRDGWTGDGWVYGPTEATIVIVGGACDTITSNPQTSVLQMFCGVNFGGGP